MAQEFNSPFSPFGAPKPEEELLYPEQGMQFGGTGNSLFGTQPTDGGVDPTFLAGLGLGGGIVAAGTGGAPATTGQIVPSGGSAKPPIKIAEKVGQARLPGTAGSGSEGKLRVPGASTISKLLSTGASFLFPEPLDDSTVSGAYDRLMEAGDVERAEALGYTDPLTEMANAAYQEMLARKDIPQMSRLGDEPLTFTAPTGPSSAPQRAAELAATLPDDSGLMGAPGVQGTGIPTTTLDIDGGSVTVPQALADQTFQGIGAAPMSIEETRARLGGRTLNEYLNAPSGTEGVSGLRTDPQGRMIPAGAPGTSQTRADAYGQYEDEVSQAYQRQSERMQQRADQRDGTAGPRTYGGYTTSQLRGMVGGGDNLRAAQMRAEAGLNPVTGNREKTEAERSQSEQQGQLQNQALQARIDVLKQGNPDKVKEAEDAAARMGLEGRAATIFTLGKMGINTETIFEILEASKPGGGGGGGSFTEAQQSSISKVMAANPGSSREQIIAEMKKQGKL